MKWKFLDFLEEKRLNLEKARTDSVGERGRGQDGFVRARTEVPLELCNHSKETIFSLLSMGRLGLKKEKGHVQGPSFYRTGPQSVARLCFSYRLAAATVLSQRHFEKPRDRRGWAGGERRGGHPSSRGGASRAPGWGAPPRQSWAAAPSSRYCGRSLTCAQRRPSPSSHGSNSCPA